MLGRKALASRHTMSKRGGFKWKQIFSSLCSRERLFDVISHTVDDDARLALFALKNILDNCFARSVCLHFGWKNFLDVLALLLFISFSRFAFFALSSMNRNRNEIIDSNSTAEGFFLLVQFQFSARWFSDFHLLNFRSIRFRLAAFFCIILFICFHTSTDKNKKYITTYTRGAVEIEKEKCFAGVKIPSQKHTTHCAPHKHYISAIQREKIVNFL